MKSTNHLTELACKKANTPGKKLSDGHGMYLLVHKNGSKYWRMDFRLNGKRKTYAIGVWPEISLTRARELREEAREQIQRGIDLLKQDRSPRGATYPPFINSFSLRDSTAFIKYLLATLQCSVS